MVKTARAHKRLLIVLEKSGGECLVEHHSKHKHCKLVIILLTVFVQLILLTITVSADDSCYNSNCDKLPAKQTDCYACIYANWDEELKEYARELSETMGCEYPMILAIIWNESRFQSNATNYNTNGTTDYGLMQINSSGFRFLRDEIGINSMSELYDPKLNILAGVTILNYHFEHTGDHEQALLRYQIGEGNYQRLVTYGLTPNKTYYNVIARSQDFANIVNQEKLTDIEEISLELAEKSENINTTL